MLNLLLLYGLPLAALIFFVVSLTLYLAARHQNKRAPGSVTDAALRARRLMLVIASVIAGLFVVVIVAFAVLLVTAVAFM